MLLATERPRGCTASWAQPSRTRALLIALIGLLLAAPAAAAPAPSLQEQLESIAGRVPGKLGVAVLDLDHGTRGAVRGGMPAPMASVFKLPLAVAVLRRAQE
ncbi:MAG TPA: serine hydrolase, partial [Myxococcaceae bacterium]